MDHCMPEIDYSYSLNLSSPSIIAPTFSVKDKNVVFKSKR